MFTLKPLPYAYQALEPHMSARTLEFHHGKHHQAYVDNLNKLIVGTEMENISLEEIIKQTYGQVDKVAVFNNAAQVFNHDFFWQALSADVSNHEIGPKTMAAINANFGSLESYYEKFKAAALSQFGSGWAWLVLGPNGLEIIKTANAENPLPLGFKPLFAVDVWEHSYYLDYQNRRGDFIDACLHKLCNWQQIENSLL